VWKPIVQMIEETVIHRVVGSPRPKLPSYRHPLTETPAHFVLEGPVAEIQLAKILSRRRPSHFDFPSPAPSDDDSGDRISGVIFPPRRTPRRAILLIPGWLGGSRLWFLGMARWLARRGALVAVMDLPAHFGRTPPGALHGIRFLSGDPWLSWTYLRQSVSDARTILRALIASAPGTPVTACGFSLGGWIAGASSSLEANCGTLLVTPAADPGALLRRSPLLAAIRTELEERGHDVESIAREADPLALAKLPRPGCGIRIFAGRWDEVIPQDLVTQLGEHWHAPVEFLPFGHMTPYISPGFLRRFVHSLDT
jgi:pimeloyl-ACP methyl ester carboxylesterase